MVHASADRTIRGIAQQNAGCSRNQKAKTKPCSNLYAANDFLNYSFQPLAEKIAELQNQKKVESEYFNSLQNLSALYGFIPVDVSDKGYPHNIFLSFEHAARFLNDKLHDLQLIILQDEKHSACLSTLKVFNTGTTLYYIPVEPVFRLSKNKNTKTLFDLLVSVLAYFYQVAKVPSHRNNSSYLFYNYEMIREWVEGEPGDWKRNEYKKIIRNFIELEKTGDVIFENISQPRHLSSFKDHMRNFLARNDSEKKLFIVAEKIFQLFSAFPERNIFDSIHSGLLAPETEERIYPEQYISFFYSGCGWVYEQLIENINGAFQECSAIDEPISIQIFDAPQQKELHDLTFEKKIFELIPAFAHLLYELA